MPIGFEDPFCKACGAQGQARGTAPGPRTGGMETHAAGGVPAALRLHPLPPGVETGHLGAGSATGAADPRGGGVGAAGPCPGVHVGLPDSSRPGDLLAHRQQRDPGKRSGHAVRRSPPLRWCGGPRRRRFPHALRSHAGGTPSAWRHTRRGDRYVTVIIDLTPVRHRSDPARLLDVVPGRSKKVLKTWLSQRDQDWRGRVEMVAAGRFHRVPRAPPARSSHRPGRSWTPSTSYP